LNEQDKLVFVVQKHKAMSLHYDFRLEIGGVMPSWSIPKGPTLDSSVRRLALLTEDHDLSYRTFEGVLPEGYGAGPVMVWDEGTYYPEIEIEKGMRSVITSKTEGDKAMQKGMKEGNLKFRLYGKKLHGSYALVRTKGFGRTKGESWLFIKHKDEFSMKGYDAADNDFSAVTNRSMAQISKEGSKQSEL
jgi:bifunctional non-homologous end joining protein LigD